MVSCPHCSRAVGKNAQALRCFRCNEWFHLPCQNLDSDDYPFMSKSLKLGFQWYCTQCRSDSGDTSLSVVKEGLKDVVSPILAAIQDLSVRLGNLETASSTPSASVRSFAGIVKQQFDDLKRGHPTSGQSVQGLSVAESLPRSEVLVLKPKSGTNADAVETVKRVEKALRSIPVNSCTTTKAGSFIVKLPTSGDKAEARKVIDTCFGSDSDFTVSEPKKILPKMTVVGIPVSVKDDDIIPLICDKSEDIRRLKDDGYLLSLIFTKVKAETKFAVLKMSPEIRKSILSKNSYVYVGLNRCKAYDRYWVTQCYHCQKFGHLATDCSKKSSPPVCGFCAGEHDSRSCKERSTPCCTNCSALPDAPHSVHHFAFSMDCPIMISQRKKVMENTAQITSENPKNGDRLQ